MNSTICIRTGLCCCSSGADPGCSKPNEHHTAVVVSIRLPMPSDAHQLEAFKISRHFRLHENRLVIALIVASIVGTIVSIVGHVALNYEYRFAQWGVGEFNRLQSWIIAPRAPNIPAIQHIVFVFLFTSVLTFLKRQFLWWPFYPVGYAVGNGWAIGWMWFSIFLGWLF